MLATLGLNNQGEIEYSWHHKREVIKDLSVLFSVDENGATIQKIAEKDYVELVADVHRTTFQDSEESYCIAFSLSKLTNDNNKKLGLANYFINHTLSSKVKDLIVAVKEENFEKAQTIADELIK